MQKIAILYIPVLHEGYIRFFEKHKDAETLYILSDEVIKELSSYHKEIRGVDSKTIRKAIEALGIFPQVEVLTKDNLSELSDKEIVTVDEEVSREFVQKYLPHLSPSAGGGARGGGSVEFDSVFLRWDEKKVNSDVEVKYDRVSQDPFDREMCDRAASIADKSSDWWRHVGCVVVKDGNAILEAHNHHVPSEQMQYAQGDPRDFVKAGTLNLVYSSLHAEQSVVAEAARRGLSLEGAHIYMNVFPCPLCAKLVAYSGITKCFFRSGSAWLDAESILKAKGVEIVLVSPPSEGGA